MGRLAKWLSRRWLLCVAALAAGMILFAASRVVWRIDVLDGGAYTADIHAALTEMGVKLPVLRSRLDLGKLRDDLEWRYPRIAWFECGFRGATLVIRSEAGTLPRKDNGLDGACDVVAARDGVIYSVVTKAGTPVVEIGDVVRAGDVLIRGEERTSDGAIRSVAARGNVFARVWEGAATRMPATETITTYTGNQQTVWTLRTPWFDLWPMAEAAYAQYDTAVSETRICGIYLPITLRVETRMEAEYTLQRREQDALEADAYAAALRKLHEKLAPEESLIDIWGNCSMIDSENVWAVAIGEMRVDIGTQCSVSGMAAPEQDSPDESRDNAE